MARRYRSFPKDEHRLMACAASRRCRASMISILLLVASAGIAGAGSTTAERTQERNDRLEELDTMESTTVVEMREVCLRGLAWEVKAKQEAKGRGFPDVHEICRGAIDAQAQQKLSQFLYLNLALQDMGKAVAVDSSAELAMVSHGEATKLVNSIVAAASKGATEFRSPLSGKTYSLRTELAYDAGHWLGLTQPNLVPALTDIETERGAKECYERNNRSSISLAGKMLPATKACLIIGGYFGKQIAAATLVIKGN
jgi:hypothetical protein